MTLIKTDDDRARPRLVAWWLWLCVAMVFAMAIIGAVTRLTESGLSITEWKPITGAIPPLNAVDWQHEFDLYRATPEYRHKNAGMNLAEFKNIYFWEWLHRLWGRLIGVVFFVPFLLLWFSARIPNWLNGRLWGLLALGGAQGFIGWFMVQSGLVDRPSVSHYRLALHLAFALILYAVLIWLALSLQRQNTRPTIVSPPVKWSVKLHALVALLLLSAAIVWGAFVAGLDAGLIYNEFPTMGAGRLMPQEMWHTTPAWLNLFENHASVQFTHRWLAIIAVLVILSLATHALLADVPGRVFSALAVMALLQAGLGILTLLSGINIYAATLHQGGALILLGLLMAALHAIFHRPRA